MNAPQTLLQAYHERYKDRLPEYNDFARGVMQRNDPDVLEGMANYLHRDAYPSMPREEFDERTGMQAWRDARPSWAGNVARGMGERTTDLLSGLATTIRTGAEAFTGETAGTIRQLEKALDAVDLGYEARSTWEKVKEDPGVSSVLAYGLEQGLVSLPDMAAAVAALPAYAAARAGEMAQDRAEMDEREGQATGRDVVEMLPYAIAESLLERFGARKVLGITDALRKRSVAGVASATARGAAAETGTEALQSALETFGTRFGTKRPASLEEIAEQALAGGVAGAVFGGAVRGVTATGQAVTGRGIEGEQPPPTTDRDREEAATGEQARRLAPPSRRLEGPDPRLPPPPIRPANEQGGPTIEAGGPETGLVRRDPTIAMPDETSGPTINAPGPDNPDRSVMSLQLEAEADQTGKRRRLAVVSDFRPGLPVVVDHMDASPPAVGVVRHATGGRLRIEGENGRTLFEGDVSELPSGVPAIYEFVRGRTAIEEAAGETVEVEDRWKSEAARLLRAAHDNPDDALTYKRLEKLRSDKEFGQLETSQKDAFDSMLSFLGQRQEQVKEARGLVDKVRSKPDDMAARARLGMIDARQWAFPEMLTAEIQQALGMPVPQEPGKPAPQPIPLPPGAPEQTPPPEVTPPPEQVDETGESVDETGESVDEPPAAPPEEKPKRAKRYEDVGEAMAGARKQAKKTVDEASQGEGAEAARALLDLTSQSRKLQEAIPDDAEPDTRKFVIELTQRTTRSFSEFAFGRTVPSNWVTDHFNDNPQMAEDLRERATAYVAGWSVIRRDLETVGSVKEAVDYFRGLLNPEGDAHRYRIQDPDLARLFKSRVLPFLRQADNWKPSTGTARKLSRPSKRLEEITRTGPERREAEQDIKPETLMETFGFRGVEFGNWTRSKEQRLLVNHAWDALHDLAEVMGIEPKNMGLGGLGLAFGSRGRGRHAAHYEPGTLVVNLTKTRGDGSLAHEWGHALDYALKEHVMNQLKRALTVRYPLESVQRTLRDFFTGDTWVQRRVGGNIRGIQGAEYYIDERLWRSVRWDATRTDFKKEGDKLGKKYWGSEVELWARGFESWVYDRLDELDIQSEYLVSEWVEDNRVTKEQGYRGRPYPTGGERFGFGELFKAVADNLTFDAEGKPALKDADAVIAVAEGVSGERAVREYLAEKRGDLRAAAAEAAMGGRDQKKGLDAYGPIVKAVATDFIGGKVFDTIVQARKRVQEIAAQVLKEGEALPTRKGTDEIMETAVVAAARQIVEQETSPQHAYRKLIELYIQQPNLSVRTSTSVRDQAYSTPIPLAYLASRLAGVRSAGKILEPSAGNGALLVEADPARQLVMANEINDGRRDTLIKTGFKTSRHDASRRLAPIEEHAPYDVVIANPPFGTVKEGDGVRVFKLTAEYQTTQIDHAISLRALDNLADKGRAVLIVGGVKEGNDAQRAQGYQTAAKRSFYFHIYENFNVTDHFTVSGDLYKKQGAAWPVDVIVIDGKGKSARELPAVDLPPVYQSWDQLAEKIGEQTDDATGGTRPPAPPESPEERPPGGDGGVDGPTRPDGGDRGGRGDTGGGRGGGVGGRGDRPQRPPRRPPVSDEQPRPPDEDGDVGGTGPRDDGDLNLGDDFGKDNTLFTKDDHDAALEDLQDLFNQASAGFDPRIAMNGIKIAGFYIEGGARKFVDFSRIMLQKLGEKARPYLAYWYNAVRDFPGVGPIAEDMDSREDVARIEREQAEGPREPREEPTEPEPREPRAQDITQVPYKPASGVPSVDTLVPVNLVDSTDRALEELQKRVGNVDEFVAQELGYDDLAPYFSAEQVDALALALDNMQREAGFVLGDQTGVGKGRVVAGVMRYALRNDMTALFFTDQPNLYQDMWRDLKAIDVPGMLGTEDFIEITNREKVQLEGGPLLAAMTPARERALLNAGSLGDKRVLFTTYSQIQTVQGAVPNRVRLIEALAPNSILALDESHKAGGQGSGQRRSRGGGLPRSRTARNLISIARGVFYSSATYAKRPDVMDLYSKTDMRYVSQDAEALAASIHAGGIPMQQIVAQNLSDASQYIRRERSFDGVDYTPEVVPVDQQTYADFSEVLMRVHRLSRAVNAMIKNNPGMFAGGGGAAASDTATGETGASSTNFASVMHNLIEQMLLAAKADQAATKAIEAHKRGERPVLTVANTMGSFLESYTEQAAINYRSTAHIGFSDVMNGYLERARSVTVRDAYGNKERVRLTDEELGPAIVGLYDEAKNVIDNSDFSAFPVSPIDWMHYRMREAGMTSGEITGRSSVYRYTGQGVGVYEARPQRDKTPDGKNKTIAEFNAGRLNAVILNQSGSTGLSLHASQDFADQNKRRMIIAQAERNIDTHMQILGRIHRTGQVTLPAFDQLVADVPAEKRPAAVLKSKMASLNANTTARRGSKFEIGEAVDFFDDVGNEIVAQMVRLEESPWKAIYDVQMGKPKLGDSAARVVTGRIPLLPVDMQEELYAEIEANYRETVEQMEAEGKSVREVKPQDLDAKQLAQTEVVPGIQGLDSPFAAAVVAGEYDVRVMRKPPSAAEVMEKVAFHLGVALPEGTPDQQLAVIEPQAREIMDDKIERLRNEMEEYLRLHERASPQQNVEMFNRVRMAMETLTPGRAVEVDGELGIIVRIFRRSAQSTPVSPAIWVIEMAVLGGARYMRVPVNRADLGGIEQESGTELQMVTFKVPQPGTGARTELQQFDDRREVERENASILTGNILAAYGWANNDGTIIMFEDERGQIQPGVRMPDDWDLRTYLESRPVVIPTGAVLKALLDTGYMTGKRKYVMTTDETVRVVRRRTEYMLEVPGSRAAGAQYFLNREVLDAAGADFERVGAKMRVTFQAERFEATMDAVMDAGAKFQVPNDASIRRMLDEAAQVAAIEHARDPANAKLREQVEGFLRNPNVSESVRQGITLQPVPKERRGGGWRPADDRATIRELRDLLATMAPGVRLQPTTRARLGEETQGYTFEQGDEVLIRVAMDGQQRDTLHHEVIHALRTRGLFTEREWATLVEAARQGQWVKKHRVDRNYAELNREGQYEEAIAEEFSTWARNGGVAPKGRSVAPIQRIFTRIAKFFAGLADLLRFRGYEVAANNIFEDVAEGRVGRRRRQRVQEAGERAKVWHRRRKPTEEPIVSFDNPEVERRFQEAKGVPLPTIIQKVVDGLKVAWRRVTRHREHIAETQENADLLEKMYHLEHASNGIKEKIHALFTRMSDGLSEPEIDLMTRKLMLDDLLWTARQGMELPQGFRNAAEVKLELRKVDAALESLPQVRERIDIRNAARRDLRDRMVEAGVLRPEQARNPSYFRHQVLEYAKLRARAAAGNKVKTPFWHRREGSDKDINTSLFEVEAEWMFKAEMDIATANFLGWLGDSKYNRFQEYSRRAKADNNKGLLDALQTELLAAGVTIEASTPLDLARKVQASRKAKMISERQYGQMPLMQRYNRFRGRIGYNLQRLREYADQMTTEEYTAMPARLRGHLATFLTGKNAGSVNDEAQQQPLFALLAWLAESSDANPGMRDAAHGIYAALGQRQAWIRKDVLGRSWTNPRDARSLIKRYGSAEEQAAWQADSFDGKTRAVNMFTAQTVPEHITQRLMDEIATHGALGIMPTRTVEALIRSIKEQKVVGGPKAEMILPTGVAEELNNFSDDYARGALDGIVKEITRRWKQWILFNPRRFAKYYLNNMSGDIDAILANPSARGIVRELGTAFREMHAHLYRGGQPSEQMVEAMEAGVIQSSLVMQEIQEHGGFDAPEFNFRKGSVPIRAVRAYFKSVTKFARLRENAVRYAAYRYYRRQFLDEGKTLEEIGYGASPPHMVRGLTSRRDKAARMARDALGDYGNLSVTSRWLRDRVLPFWSWVASNTTRYNNLFRNAYYTARDRSVTQGVGMGALAGASLAARIFIFYGMVQLWNNLLFSDEEESLSTEERLRLHAILGKDSEGRVYSMRFQGALSDYLGWIGMENVGATLSEVVKGRASVADIPIAMAKGPVNRVVNSVSPVFKLPIELALGRPFFPDVFRPRALRDPWDHAVRTFSLQHEYAAAAKRLGKPVPTRSYGESLVESLVYTRDPGELAYDQIRSKAFRWLERERGSAVVGSTTPRGDALRAYRRAVRFDDRISQQAALEQLRAAGGGAKNIRASISRSSPLGMLGKRDQAHFLSTLSDRERDMLRRARQWYSRTYGVSR